jgi:hypothetical protein
VKIDRRAPRPLLLGPGEGEGVKEARVWSAPSSSPEPLFRFFLLLLRLSSSSSRLTRLFSPGVLSPAPIPTDGDAIDDKGMKSSAMEAEGPLPEEVSRSMKLNFFFSFFELDGSGGGGSGAVGVGGIGFRQTSSRDEMRSQERQW